MSERGWMWKILTEASILSDQLPRFAGGTGREHDAIVEFYEFLVATQEFELARRLRVLLGGIPKKKTT